MKYTYKIMVVVVSVLLTALILTTTVLAVQLYKIKTNDIIIDDGITIEGTNVTFNLELKRKRPHPSVISPSLSYPYYNYTFLWSAPKDFNGVAQGEVVASIFIDREYQDIINVYQDQNDDNKIISGEEKDIKIHISLKDYDNIIPMYVSFRIVFTIHNARII